MISLEDQMVSRLTATRLFVTALGRTLVLRGVLTKQDVELMRSFTLSVAEQMQEENTAAMQVGGQQIETELLRLFDIVDPAEVEVPGPPAATTIADEASRKTLGTPTCC